MVLWIAVAACTHEPEAAERVAIIDNAQVLLATSNSVLVATQQGLADPFMLYELVDGAPTYVATFTTSVAASSDSEWVGWLEGTTVARRTPSGVIERQPFAAPINVLADADGLYVLDSDTTGFVVWRWSDGAPARLPRSGVLPDVILDGVGYFTYAGMGIKRIDLMTGAVTDLVGGSPQTWPILRGVGAGRLVYAVGNEIEPVELHEIQVATTDDRVLGTVPNVRTVGEFAAVSADAVFWGPYRFRDGEYERYLTPSPTLPLGHHPSIVVYGNDVYWLSGDLLYRYPTDSGPVPASDPAVPVFQ